MRKSIFLKLFVITTLVITLFIGLMLYMQSAFFERYYVYKKTQAINASTKHLLQVCTPYVSDQVFTREMDQFTQKYNAVVFYQDISNPPESTSLSKYFYRYLDFLMGVNGATFDKDFYIKQLIQGQAVYKKNKALMDKGKIISYDVKNAYGNNSIVTVSAVVDDGQTIALLYVVTSLQPIGEAAAVIRDYYGLFFLAAFVMVLLLSLIYARQISRPLIHLNKVASGIAQLDFSHKCQLQTQDELGQLSQTINFLSDNLNQTINSLQSSNFRLNKELERQKELENMRREFVAGVSHELKTPISIIRGYGEGILDGIEKGSINKEYIDIIMDETEQMNALLAGMLDLYQLESGKTELNIEPLSINRLISYVIKKMLPSINDKAIDLQISSGDDELLVLGDGFRIEQVVSNLLSNAIKYTPRGGYISASMVSNGDELMITIENSTTNIPSEELDRIWEHFYRLDKSRNKDSGGTGLGLAIVKNILQLHNSSFGVENTHIGVRFYFTLKKYEGD